MSELTHGIADAANAIHDLESASRVIGKYALFEEIGRGSKGAVYRAHDPFVEREVAIKLTPLSEFDNGRGGISALDFFAEARTAGRLQHPNIATVFDAGVDDDSAYVVMEYVPGETLEGYLPGHGKSLSVTEVVSLMQTCARALDYAHGQGVLHRDIKPGNIMFSSSGVPKIIDFSIAQVLGDAPLEAAFDGTVDMVQGSPMYIPPEALHRELLTPAADIYSLAVVAWQLLSDQVLFSANSLNDLFKQIAICPPARLSDINPNVPDGLSRAIDRALAKRPGDRFTSGNDFSRAIGRFAGHSAAGQSSTPGKRKRALRKLTIFQGLDDESIAILVTDSPVIPIEGGAPIVSEGDIDDALFVLVEGGAIVSKAGVGISTISEGECFGEIALLTGGRRTATVEATCDSQVMRISRDAIETLPLDAQLKLNQRISELLVYRLTMTTATMASMF